MTPIPLHLPVRPNEAAELAALIFEQAERKPLNDELRNRLAARAAVLRLESITPYFGSLARDPVHPSTYYLAVDGIEAPLLLHIALSNAPTSSVFHKPLLIGRTRRMNGPEFLVNAIPFGPGDREAVGLYAAKVDGAVMPRPQGSRATVTIRSEHARAFEFFRGVHKRRGRNLAAVAGDYHACVWAAIRAGWRQEYTVAAEVSLDHTSESVRETLSYTRFAVDVTGLARGEAAWKAAAQEHEEIRQARALLKSSGEFDFEVELGETASEELDGAIEWLRGQGHAPQMVRVGAGISAEAAQVARRQKVTLSFRYAGEKGSVVEAVAAATGGRLNYYVENPVDAETVCEHLLG